MSNFPGVEISNELSPTLFKSIGIDLGFKKFKVYDTKFWVEGEKNQQF